MNTTCRRIKTDNLRRDTPANPGRLAPSRRARASARRALPCSLAPCLQKMRKPAPAAAFLTTDHCSLITSGGDPAKTQSETVPSNIKPAESITSERGPALGTAPVPLYSAAIQQNRNHLYGDFTMSQNPGTAAVPLYGATPIPGRRKPKRQRLIAPSHCAGLPRQSYSAAGASARRALPCSLLSRSLAPLLPVLPDPHLRMARRHRAQPLLEQRFDFLHVRNQSAAHHW